jgi:hypothetical protein
MFMLKTAGESKRRRLIDENEIARRVVARFSRGNIRLQRGQYLTREDIDRRLERILERARYYGD